jgi:hypothetical protein
MFMLPPHACFFVSLTYFFDLNYFSYLKIIIADNNNFKMDGWNAAYGYPQRAPRNAPGPACNRVLAQKKPAPVLVMENLGLHLRPVAVEDHVSVSTPPPRLLL